MYAATVGCQVRDTDALFMQHRKVNISTKRRRRRRRRARSPSSWLRLRAYFSRMDNYPEGVTLRGEEESRVASRWWERRLWRSSASSPSSLSSSSSSPLSFPRSPFRVLKRRVLGPLTRNLLAFDRRGFDLEPVDERSANALHYS